MATTVMRKTLKSVNPFIVLRTLSSFENYHFTTVATVKKPEPQCPSSFTCSEDEEAQLKKTNDDDDSIVHLRSMAMMIASFISKARSRLEGQIRPDLCVVCRVDCLRPRFGGSSVATADSGDGGDVLANKTLVLISRSEATMCIRSTSGYESIIINQMRD
ncbi:hypothetical protein ACSBR1_027680 [Camellia fascicularis]